MRINFFSEKFKAKKISSRLQRDVNDILLNGSYTNGKHVKKLENFLKNFFKVKYAIAVNNGTSALHLSLLALNIKEDDEVIIPSLTFVASAASIKYVGAKPIFVDINDKDWLINVNKIEEAINKRTKAIMVVHLHGLMCDMKEIKNIARKHKLKIIEDSAQAHGSEYLSRFPGYFGDAATLSFYPTKNLGAIGEGGAILTNNKNIFLKAQRMRTWSQKNYDFIELGFNFRMSEFIAASLIQKSIYLKNDIIKRIQIAKIYKKKLNNKTFSLFDEKQKKHSYHIFAIRVKNREKIMKQLLGKGISTNIHYPYNLSDLKILNTSSKKRNLTARAVSKDILSLPIYPELKKTELNYIIETINKFC